MSHESAVRSGKMVRFSTYSHTHTRPDALTYITFAVPRWVRDRKLSFNRSFDLFFLLPPALLLRLRLGMETMYAAWGKLTRRTMVMVFFCCCYFQWKMDGKLKHTVRHSERARAQNSTVSLTQYD